MGPFRYHAFVCTQEKSDGAPCCAGAGSVQVLDALHRELGANGLSDEVQVSSCGCLGLCDSGPVMVVYPEGTWYTKLASPEISEIVTSHLQNGKPVDRLLREDRRCDEGRDSRSSQQVSDDAKGKEAAGVLPDDIVDLIRGFMPSRAVLTALELDIFTAVGEGGTASQVATRIQGGDRATEMLRNALVSLKLWKRRCL